METYIKTPLGVVRIVGDENGISVISVVDEDDRSVQKHTTNPSQEANLPPALQQAVSELNDYFSAKRTEFTFKLNPSGTDFQKKVWNELLKIPFGTTTSYLALSKKLGDVKAIRAVASANGRNPLWIVVPCHRVIGSNGSLTGYAGGLWRKQWLLDHESPPTQQVLF